MIKVLMGGGARGVGMVQRLTICIFFFNGINMLKVVLGRELAI